MNQQLPIKKIFIRSLEMPIERHKELIRLCWPYAFLILGSSFISGKIDGTALNIAYTGLFLLTGILGAVSCHRVFLLSADQVSQTPTLRWSRRETRFLLYTIGLAILVSVMTAPVVAATFFILPSDLLIRDHAKIVTVLFLYVLYLPAFYILSRWSLILPSCAVDHNVTPSSSWNMSSSNSLRLFVLVGFLPLITGLISESIALLTEPSYALSFIHHSIFLIVTVIEVCLLSLSYKWFVDNVEAN